MSLQKHTQQLVVYIEAEDYRKLKQLGSSSKGMSKIVRALIKGYLARAQVPDLPIDALDAVLGDTPDAA